MATIASRRSSIFIRPLPLKLADVSRDYLSLVRLLNHQRIGVRGRVMSASWTIQMPWAEQVYRQDRQRGLRPSHRVG